MKIKDAQITETENFWGYFDSRESEGFEQHPTLEITYILAVGGEGEIIHLNRLTLLTPYIIIVIITLTAIVGIRYQKRVQ